MESIFNEYNPKVLVETVMWVFRSYIAEKYQHYCASLPCPVRTFYPDRFKTVMSSMLPLEHIKNIGILQIDFLLSLIIPHLQGFFPKNRKVLWRSYEGCPNLESNFFSCQAFLSPTVSFLNKGYCGSFPTAPQPPPDPCIFHSTFLIGGKDKSSFHIFQGKLSPTCQLHTLRPQFRNGKGPPALRITPRSMTFSNSRTLPGQW